jgi:hypothetical protein
MATTIKFLQPPDNHHLQAAIGWLELGNHTEANEELKKITPQHRVHPDVLQVHLHIYVVAQKWDLCLDIANAIIELDPDRGGGQIPQRVDDSLQPDLLLRSNRALGGGMRRVVHDGREYRRKNRLPPGRR